MIDKQAAQPVPRHEDLVDQGIVVAYFLFALGYLALSMLAGLLMSLQLVYWNPLNGLELFSPGRWRMVHTNVIAYGFLANAFLGALHWAVPRLVLKPVLDWRLSWFILIAWQVVVLGTGVGIVLGPTLQANIAGLESLPFSLGAQGLEWGETPTWIDPLALAGLALVAVNFMAPIVRTGGPLYVTSWYFIAAFVWTFLTYAMGNFLPQYWLAGTSAGAVGGLFIHDLVGLFVTPLGWGLMYYFVPVMLKKPMWSHGLSLVGFWGLAFFYPLNGIHHFLYTPIPMFLQYGAIISTIAVEMVVTTVIINFFGTIWGSGRALVTNLPIRWFYTGMVFYAITCAQCALQTTLTFQALIHFSDWVVGHAHMVMFGVFSMWLLGIMTYLFPRLWNTEWYSRPLAEWHYWLSTVGLFVMAADLIMVGVFQGYNWASLVPWEVSVQTSQPFWILRVFAGLAMMAGQGCFFYNLYMTWRMSRAEAAPAAASTESGPARPVPQAS
jgi:cytochrome c oxidase cbb3-type subunit 1